MIKDYNGAYFIVLYSYIYSHKNPINLSMVLLIVEIIQPEVLWKEGE